MRPLTLFALLAAALACWHAGAAVTGSIRRARMKRIPPPPPRLVLGGSQRNRVPGGETAYNRTPGQGAAAAGGVGGVGGVGGDAAQKASPASEAASEQDGAAPTTPAPIQCTATGEGITYSVEKCNKTNKTILKVSVRDQYTTRLPPPPPPPPPPSSEEPPSEEPRHPIFWGSEEDHALSDYDNYRDPDYEDGSDLSNEHTVEHERIAQIMREENEKVMREILAMAATAPTTTTTTARASPAANARPQGPFVRLPWRHHWGLVDLPPRPVSFPDWRPFCEEAARDDDEPFRVPDGAFHPKFEALPGLGFYRFHARPRTWEDARRQCEREGAHLAVANSEKEARALSDLHNRCPSLIPSHFNDYQFLGVHDQFGEGHWETVLGQRLNETGFERWAFNQPDNAHHAGENCLTMNRFMHFNDVPCWVELPFTCEHL